MRLGVIIVCSFKGIIQDGECTIVGAASAWPLITLITGCPNSFTNTRLGRGHRNTNQK